MAGAPPVAERLVEARTMLGMTIPADDLGDRMPAGWTAVPFPEGPSAGANALVVLADRLLGLDGSGAALPGQEQLKMAVLAVRAAHPQEGGALVILAGLVSAAAPGPYDVFEPAAAGVARTRRGLPNGAVLADESWTFTGARDASARVDLSFTAGVPIRREPPNNRVRAVSAARPDFSRTYVSDHGEDVVFSAPAGIDRIHGSSIAIGGGPFGRLLDRAALVSVSSVPWLVRTVTVP